MVEFLQIGISGVALGCLYALVALGFVVVFNSSGVINLAQGGFMVLGAYLTFTARVTWGLPFWLAILVPIVMCAVLGLMLEAVVMRRLRASGILPPVLITLGVFVMIEALVVAIWGHPPVFFNDPWGLSVLRWGGLAISERNVVVIIATAITLVGLFTLFRFSNVGLAMRAAASDQEAALAQGMSPGLTVGLSWAIAGLVGTLAGIMLGTDAGGGARVQIMVVAFAALPAIIVGGLGSPLGAVLGGIVMGLAQQYAAGYAPSSLGAEFSQIMPYIVMIVILLIRPYGLFGSSYARRG